MSEELTIIVEDWSGRPGCQTPCWHAWSHGDKRYGGFGQTPLEAVAEVFRHMGKLSLIETLWERRIKYPLMGDQCVTIPASSAPSTASTTAAR